MACGKWQVLISRRHRSDICAQEERALLDHLKVCDECSELEQKFERVEHFLAESLEPEIPQFLHQRIVARVSEEMRRDAEAGLLGRLLRPFAILRPVLAAGLMLTGIFLGIWTGTNLAGSLSSVPSPPAQDLVTLAMGNGAVVDQEFEFLWSERPKDGGR